MVFTFAAYAIQNWAKDHHASVENQTITSIIKTKLFETKVWGRNPPLHKAFLTGKLVSFFFLYFLGGMPDAENGKEHSVLKFIEEEKRKKEL